MFTLLLLTIIPLFFYQYTNTEIIVLFTISLYLCFHLVGWSKIGANKNIALLFNEVHKHWSKIYFYLHSNKRIISTIYIPNKESFHLPKTSNCARVRSEFRCGKTQLGNLISIYFTIYIIISISTIIYKFTELNITRLLFHS